MIEKSKVDALKKNIQKSFLKEGQSALNKTDIDTIFNRINKANKKALDKEVFYSIFDMSKPIKRMSIGTLRQTEKLLTYDITETFKDDSRIKRMQDFEVSFKELINIFGGHVKRQTKKDNPEQQVKKNVPELKKNIRNCFPNHNANYYKILEELSKATGVSNNFFVQIFSDIVSIRNLSDPEKKQEIFKNRDAIIEYLKNNKGDHQAFERDFYELYKISKRSRDRIENSASL